MSEMIDGFTAQKIKDFWMNVPNRFEKADIEALLKIIEAKDAEIKKLHTDYTGVIREKDKIIERQDGELAELKLDSPKFRYANMCRNGHDRIGHNNRSGCPVCELKQAAEMLWIVLANVSNGDWKKQTTEWMEAAQRWRDNYFKCIAAYGKQEGA